MCKCHKCYHNFQWYGQDSGIVGTPTFLGKKCMTSKKHAFTSCIHINFIILVPVRIGGATTRGKTKDNFNTSTFNPLLSNIHLILLQHKLIVRKGTSKMYSAEN